ncbi:MAG: GNAT family N-acetyltransferase [Nocardioides sp.]
MSVATADIRPLGPADLDSFVELSGQDPVVNVFTEYRARSSKLEPRWLGGEIWGRFEGGGLVAACHVGANLVPVQATVADAEAFGRRANEKHSPISTIFGPQAAVRTLFDVMGERRRAPRDLRMGQPHLEISSSPAIAADPAVRLSTPADLGLLYPACVAMYTEEVGISPESGPGGEHYRVRIGQLVERQWSFVRIEEGQVVFKAEVACATPSAAQIQGVYVSPRYRGHGLAAPAIASVVRHIHDHIAPVASLYVNDWNLAARRAYARCGFLESARFGTVMFQ